MKRGLLDVLVSPSDCHSLEIHSVEVEIDEEIKEGLLSDRALNRLVPIQNYIPRFVRDSGYTESFGKQWNRYRRTQVDRFNGTDISAERFFKGTEWDRKELRGQRILEVGCGAGRFTQVMLDAGAIVYALDYSSAVDAAWLNHGPNPNLHLIQADVYSLPFRKAFFDKVFCYGVLQHTPDPKRAFKNLVAFLRPGGKLAIDCYPRTRRPSRWTSKYLWRPLTTRLPHEFLFRIIEWYVPRWLRVDNGMERIPRLRQCLAALIPCWNYTGILPLTPEQIKEWAILDTFDALSPRYDLPQTVESIRLWFEEARFLDIHMRPGGNGVLGNGRSRADD